MEKGNLTKEFSICLLPDDDTTNQVLALRRQLPPSPYRDDRPHITLLRGISSSKEVSDEALLADIESTLMISKRLPLTATVEEIVNKSNQFYSSSGLLMLKASAELLAYRKEIAVKLTESEYAVELQELETFMPHITIRLGVPVEGDMLEAAQQLFGNRTITFNHWLLFRLVEAGGSRAMHEAWPSIIFGPKGE